MGCWLLGVAIFVANTGRWCQVMGLTNQTAVDFGPEGIRINAICPGFMVHPQNDDALRDDEEMQEYFREQYPVGRCEPSRSSCLVFGFAPEAGILLIMSHVV